MRISSSDLIVGRPALQIRDLLKAAQREPGASGPWLVERVLKVGPKEAQEVVDALKSEGYVEPYPYRLDDESLWMNTSQGNALANASAALPIRRRVAEQKLAEFLERVREINSRDDFLYGIQRVVLFGSFVG